MSRLRSVLSTVAAEQRKAMGLFLTNGFPDLESTVPLLRALEAGGADFLELGMPFSDPLAEGLPIQHSSAQALAGGVQMEDAFRTVRAFRENSDTPLLLMGYVNPILQYGPDNFCAAAGSSGADGLIIPDLPPEEAGLITEPAKKHHLDTIFLVAPNTPGGRAQAIDRLSEGFVYAVSVTGVTGAPLEHRMDTVVQYLARVRTIIQHNPLLAGFGVRTAEDARQLCRHADGFIAGSALVPVIETLWKDETLSMARRIAGVQQFARRLSAAAAPHPRLL